MNNRQTELWTNLSALVNSNEAFFFFDRELNERWYRIFNYRLASYTDFLLPDAMECRGSMFMITEAGDNAEPILLVSLPFEKFFNLFENPMTMELDLSTVVDIDTKADGSLISTYIHYPIGFFDTPLPDPYSLRLKSKGALESDQAIAAMKWLNLPENEQFKNELLASDRLGYTTNMEWIAPDNRIVLGYEEPELVVLGVRSREDGSYIKSEDIDADNFPEILARWTDKVDLDPTLITTEEFVRSIPNMQKIEGFVLTLESGQRVKVKTTWYLTLHHTKDSINCPRRLYEAVLEEATDDMRSLFHDDPLAIKMIAEMEAFVEVKYNHLVSTVERFCEHNKDLTRREFAILGQKELTGMEFKLAIQQYIGKPLDYKAFMKSKWKTFGLSDENVEIDNV